MEYKEIIQAIRNYSEFVEASSQKFSGIPATGENNFTDAGFENIVCEYVDALNEVKKIKNINKRYILIYDALGYYHWEIAEKFKISRQAVDKIIKWLKRFFREENKKERLEKSNPS